MIRAQRDPNLDDDRISLGRLDPLVSNGSSWSLRSSTVRLSAADASGCRRLEHDFGVLPGRGDGDPAG
jgi:hypothetical protein